MYKLIGNRKEFAIQYEITNIVDQFVYGHICYWINGMQIGELEYGTIISDALIFLPQIVKDNGNREHNSFFNMAKEDVYYLLGGQAYLDDEKYEEMALEEMWARFNIKIGLDVFNNTIIKLIDNQKNSRIVFSKDNKVIYDFYLDRGIVDKVFLTFYNEFNSFYEEQVLRNC